MGKKKAADFYFTKKSDSKPTPVKDDFMSKEIAPPQTPPANISPSKVSPTRQSVKMSGGFTYDTVLQENNSPSKAT